MGNISAESSIGADLAIAATKFIAVDIGSYQQSEALAQTRKRWILAMVTDYMAGAKIFYSIPVAMKMIKPADRKHLAEGVMIGFITIPIGVLVAFVIIALANPIVREKVATSGDTTY